MCAAECPLKTYIVDFLRCILNIPCERARSRLKIFPFKDVRGQSWLINRTNSSKPANCSTNVIFLWPILFTDPVKQRALCGAVCSAYIVSRAHQPAHQELLGAPVLSHRWSQSSVIRGGACQSLQWGCWVILVLVVLVLLVLCSLCSFVHRLFSYHQWGFGGFCNPSSTCQSPKIFKCPCVFYIFSSSLNSVLMRFQLMV